MASKSIKTQEDYDKLISHLSNDKVWETFPPQVKTKHLMELQEVIAQHHFEKACQDLKKSDALVNKVKKSRSKREKTDAPPENPDTQDDE